MGDLTKNFSLSEFNCKDGTAVPTKYICNVTELAKQLQVLRDEVDQPIDIESGYRTPTHNKKVGGAKNSQHLYGTAADIKVRNMTPKEVVTKIEEMILQGKLKNGGLGLYASWVHYDIGPVRRWRG